MQGQKLDVWINGRFRCTIIDANDQQETTRRIAESEPGFKTIQFLPHGQTPESIRAKLATVKQMAAPPAQKKAAKTTV
jgi:hypothetical protein